MLKQLLLGKALKNQHLNSEKLSKLAALAILSSDAISSVAYATQGILSTLPNQGLDWVLPITGLIIFLAATLVTSYRQVIKYYPNGGGAYTVALDSFPIPIALVAASALFVDYTLTVAVSVSAGVAAVTSAYPILLRWTVPFDIAFIFLVMIVNLRGTKDAAAIFMWPTYVFIGIMYLLIAGGIMPQTHTAHYINPGQLTLPTLSLMILLKAFSSGATALTGVEAISNSVQIFRVPSAKNAATTMLWMGIVLTTLFAGTSYLAYHFHTLPIASETTLSQIGHMVFGNSIFYYLLQWATALVLFLAANTAYAGFPVLASLLSEDEYLPRFLKARGDRLAYSNGILLLTFAAASLLLLFKGNTNALLPLYAIGVFISFSVAQAGIFKKGFAAKNLTTMFISGIGTTLTIIVFLVMAISKFTSGAWIVLILIPLMSFWFLRVHRHYQSMRLLLRIPSEELSTNSIEPITTLVIVPISGLNKVSLRSIQYARGINPHPVILHVAFSDEEEENIKAKWALLNIPPDELRFEVLRSQYRSVLRPLLRFVDGEVHLYKNQVTVVIPEFVTPKWWHRMLHNKTALTLQYGLLTRGLDVIITTVPYHLKDVE